MTACTYRIAVVIAFLAVGPALSIAIGHYAHDAPAPGTPAMPPPGWTVACEPSALAQASRLPLLACQTYPPGDDRWMPAAPLPPLPLRLPSGGH